MHAHADRPSVSAVLIGASRIIPRGDELVSLGVFILDSLAAKAIRDSGVFRQREKMVNLKVG